MLESTSPQETTPELTIKGMVKIAMTSVFGGSFGRVALRPLWAGRAAVFMLHRLSSDGEDGDGITIDSITRSLAALRYAGATFVSLRHLFELAAAGREPEPGSIAFTIDDGYADQGVMAERGFIANDCPVTVFLISGLLDGELWPWDDRISYAIERTTHPLLRIPELDLDLPLGDPLRKRRAIGTVQNLCKERPWGQAQEILAALWDATGITPPERPPPAGYEPLTWREARRLEAAGVDFAPHSVTHRIVSRLPEDEARAEIETSWQRLRTELARPVPLYAWPTGRAGDYSERDMQIAASSGLLGAVAVNNDYANFRRACASALGRFAVSRFPMYAQIADNLQYGTAIERLKQIVRGER